MEWNFLLPGQEYAGCPPVYAAIDAALNPRSPPKWWESFTLIALREITFVSRQYAQRRAELFREIARTPPQDRNPPQPG